MKKTGTTFELSASDLVNYLSCRHLSNLNRAVAEGELPKPYTWNLLLERLRERGAIHEKKYILYLKDKGHDVIEIGGIGVTDEAVSETLMTMQQGATIIVQGALSNNGWGGRIDVLRRVEKPSTLGDWSYQVIDTKLARETRAGTILQLCLYSDLLETTQGLAPEYMSVITPWSDFVPQHYRFTDYAAYFRKVKRALLEILAEPQETYPDPREHCDICQWREACDGRRRTDDHLCLVAGISRLQINELKLQDIITLKALAEQPLPLPWKPTRGSVEGYSRVREQARIQVEGRESGENRYEALPVEPGFGFTRLPPPSLGDVFFDLEGDRFVGEHGLEYLFGYVFTDKNGELAYKNEWGFTRTAEKQAFERFVDFIMARWEQYPGLHVYHYAPYEPSALKRLMGRYATKEEEIDRMLRAGLFVDLYQVVRQGIRASVESYSLKHIEPFYAFTRNTRLPDANAALASLQANLELDDVASITDETKTVVLTYNKDDCLSAAALRDWLEALRAQVVANGVDVPRPEPGDGDPPETINERMLRIQALVRRLTADISADPEERNDEQQARWILAHILDWHRREDKATWWEYFRLRDLSEEELLDERAGLSGLRFVGETGNGSSAPVHRYEFPLQETELRGEDELHCAGGDKLGKITAISLEDYTVDVKKREDTAQIHPEAVFAHTYVNTKVLEESLERLGEYVVEHGLYGAGPYQAARDLLLRQTPRTGGQELRHKEETATEAAKRLCAHLAGGILPIQGPPGSGKTFTGAQMICELVRRGKTVGITANSHKVIRNLIDIAILASKNNGVNLQCCQKISNIEKASKPYLCFTTKNEELVAALGNGVDVGGGTAWFWSRPEAHEAVDVLFVDEAAQMSLANVLAVSQAAKTVVLIGDPQQLDQPMQGSHPDGTDGSALNHILNGKQTIAPDQGLFLDKTWRLHPAICAYTSELFYNSKLTSKDGLERQALNASGLISGSGLFYLPISHEGNQNSSPEEAQAACKLVNDILDNNATWTDQHGRKKPVELDDILIITPYNAQVFEIQQRLPGARVGTVDKFQGQEAPIAIYSMATSSYADAPHGMEFLYSLNRLNVATSRARCLSIIISSPQVFEAECRTPRQIQLANAFCRYLELAQTIVQVDLPNTYIPRNDKTRVEGVPPLPEA